MLLEMLYIIGYSYGSCIHTICISCNPCNCSINNCCCKNIYPSCFNCCLHTSMCSLLVSCGKGCYDGCIGTNIEISSSHNTSTI